MPSTWFRETRRDLHTTSHIGKPTNDRRRSVCGTHTTDTHYKCMPLPGDMLLHQLNQRCGIRCPSTGRVAKHIVNDRTTPKRMTCLGASAYCTFDQSGPSFGSVLVACADTARCQRRSNMCVRACACLLYANACPASHHVCVCVCCVPDCLEEIRASYPQTRELKLAGKRSGSSPTTLWSPYLNI